MSKESEAALTYIKDGYNNEGHDDGWCDTRPTGFNSTDEARGALDELAKLNSTDLKSVMDELNKPENREIRDDLAATASATDRGRAGTEDLRNNEKYNPYIAALYSGNPDSLVNTKKTAEDAANAPKFVDNYAGDNNPFPAEDGDHQYKKGLYPLPRPIGCTLSTAYMIGHIETVTKEGFISLGLKNPVPPPEFTDILDSDAVKNVEGWSKTRDAHVALNSQLTTLQTDANEKLGNVDEYTKDTDVTKNAAWGRLEGIVEELHTALARDLTKLYGYTRSGDKITGYMSEESAQSPTTAGPMTLFEEVKEGDNKGKFQLSAGAELTFYVGPIETAHNKWEKEVKALIDHFNIKAAAVDGTDEGNGTEGDGKTYTKAELDAAIAKAAKDAAAQATGNDETGGTTGTTDDGLGTGLQDQINDLTENGSGTGTDSGSSVDLSGYLDRIEGQAAGAEGPGASGGGGADGGGTAQQAGYTPPQQASAPGGMSDPTQMAIPLMLMGQQAAQQAEAKRQADEQRKQAEEKHKKEDEEDGGAEGGDGGSVVDQPGGAAIPGTEALPDTQQPGGATTAIQAGGPLPATNGSGAPVDHPLKNWNNRPPLHVSPVVAQALDREERNPNGSDAVAAYQGTAAENLGDHPWTQVKDPQLLQNGDVVRWANRTALIVRDGNDLFYIDDGVPVPLGDVNHPTPDKHGAFGAFQRFEHPAGIGSGTTDPAAGQEQPAPPPAQASAPKPSPLPPDISTKKAEET